MVHDRFDGVDGNGNGDGDGDGGNSIPLPLDHFFFCFPAACHEAVSGYIVDVVPVDEHSPF